MADSVLDFIRTLADPDPLEHAAFRPATINRPAPEPVVPLQAPVASAVPRHDCDRAGCLKLKAQATASLFYFAKHVLAWQRPKDKNLLVEHFHGLICERAEPRENPKQLVLVPRGCLKTTILGEAYPIWCLLRDPMDTILLASATIDLSRHTLSFIKSVFERNELFRHLWPELIPIDFSKTKWSEDEVVVPRPHQVKEPSIQSIGVGGTIVGHHFRRIVYDDLVNEKHRDSPTEMQKTDDWLKYAVNLLEDPDRGPELLVGTHWGHDDIYIRRKRDGQFEVYERSIREDEHGQRSATGKSIFPEKYSDDALERLEVRLGPYGFSANMMNHPVDPSRQVFRPEWFPEVEYTADIAQRIRGWRKYILVDPALSEKKHGSFTGYVLAAVGPEFETIVLRGSKHRWQTAELLDNIFLDALRFDDDVDLVVEMRSLAKFLKYPIEERMRKTGRFFRIIETPTPNIDKEERIRGSLVPPAANLRFRFIRGVCDAVLQDARDFPFGDGNYDSLDTLSFLPQVWREGTEYVEPEPDVLNDPWNMATIVRELREGKAAGENQRFVLHRRALIGVN